MRHPSNISPTRSIHAKGGRALFKGEQGEPEGRMTDQGGTEKGNRMNRFGSRSGYELLLLLRLDPPWPQSPPFSDDPVFSSVTRETGKTTRESLAPRCDRRGRQGVTGTPESVVSVSPVTSTCLP